MPQHIILLLFTKWESASPWRRVDVKHLHELHCPKSLLSSRARIFKSIAETTTDSGLLDDFSRILFQETTKHILCLK